MVSWNVEYHNKETTNKNKGMERETTALEIEQNASESSDTGSHKYLLRQQLMAGYKDRPNCPTQNTEITFHITYFRISTETKQSGKEIRE